MNGLSYQKLVKFVGSAALIALSGIFVQGCGSQTQESSISADKKSEELGLIDAMALRPTSAAPRRKYITWLEENNRKKEAAYLSAFTDVACNDQFTQEERQKNSEREVELLKGYFEERNLLTPSVERALNRIKLDRFDRLPLHYALKDMGELAEAIVTSSRSLVIMEQRYDLHLEGRKPFYLMREVEWMREQVKSK